jgi:hypothetical protein
MNPADISLAVFPPLDRYLLEDGPKIVLKVVLWK